LVMLFEVIRSKEEEEEEAIAMTIDAHAAAAGMDSSTTSQAGRAAGSFCI
jgi:hypothetical protein